MCDVRQQSVPFFVLHTDNLNWSMENVIGWPVFQGQVASNSRRSIKFSLLQANTVIAKASDGYNHGCINLQPSIYSAKSQ